MKLFNFLRSKRAPVAPKLAETSNISKIIEIEPEGMVASGASVEYRGISERAPGLVEFSETWSEEGSGFHKAIAEYLSSDNPTRKGLKVVASKYDAEAEPRRAIVLEKQPSVKDMQDLAANADELMDKLDATLDWLKPHFTTPAHYEAFYRMRAAMEDASDAETDAILKCASKHRHLKHGRKEENV